jgi:predicted Zn-ribbon and HTH transcriptional regulator
LADDVLSGAVALGIGLSGVGIPPLQPTPFGDVLPTAQDHGEGVLVHPLLVFDAQCAVDGALGRDQEAIGGPGMATDLAARLAEADQVEVESLLYSHLYSRLRRDVLPRKMTITELHCLRCGHHWFPKKPEKPKRCAKCTSPYWDVPRKK